MRYSFPIDVLDPLMVRPSAIVFLDTARPTDEQRYSFLFTDPHRVYRCRPGMPVAAFLEQLSGESNKGWVAGYLSYEAAYQLEEKFSGAATCSGDAAWFGVFEEPLIFDHHTGTWNRPLRMPRGKRRGTPVTEHYAAPAIYPRISRKEYFRAVQKIRALIASGDVYQVNYTYDVSVSSPLHPWELYKTLREQQPVAFGSFVNTGSLAVASFSPELFFMKRGQLLRVRPMKGTAPRGRFTKEDVAVAAALAGDPKNRSENIMIVDLLRNDLGKVCVPGSIRVENLFAVERHPTLHQMTSTVEGRLRNNASFADIVKAIFPSGSVTGAPKIRAMEIIRDLEKGQRGVYCGAIGYLSPDRRAVFSVPIRTLQKNGPGTKWQYRVGSGIVWDSQPMAEWNECGQKCAFLVKRAVDFRLFESLLFSKGRFFYLHGHRQRLFDSACYFDFPLTADAWRRTIDIVEKKLQPLKVPAKVRIFCDKGGSLSWDHELLTAVGKPTAELSGTPIDPANPFLFHKTTARSWYEKSMDRIRSGRCFEVIHLNTRGELTEGARSNVFLKIRGMLVTPPVECGLLPGVLRGRLLTAGRCREKILYPQDLHKAEAVYCGNSVRGLVKVNIRS